MNNSMLKALADELSQKIISSKDDGTYFSEPFQHLVIDNFLPQTSQMNCFMRYPMLRRTAGSGQMMRGLKLRRARTGSQNLIFPMDCQAW